MKPSSDSKRRTGKGNGSGNAQDFVAAAAASSPADSAQLEAMIAVAAYFRAEQRGFAPGNELADWLQAEAEYRTEVAAEGQNLQSRL